MSKEDKVVAIEIIEPHWCDNCGKKYGKTNGKYGYLEIWFSCDCMPTHSAYFINTNNLIFKDEVKDGE